MTFHLEIEWDGTVDIAWQLRSAATQFKNNNGLEQGELMDDDHNVIGSWYTTD